MFGLIVRPDIVRRGFYLGSLLIFGCGAIAAQEKSDKGSVDVTTTTTTMTVVPVVREPTPVVKFDPQPVYISPRAALAKARSIFVRSKSLYFKASALEKELLKSEEFLLWDLAITRTPEDADLIIEVRRKAFTTHFIFSVLDTKTDTVVAAGNVDSLGGTVEDKISDSLIKKMRLARSAAPADNRKP